MPIPESQATLKSFFETGDKPTQAQFAELIDTMFYLYQAAQTAANAAVVTANAAMAATGLAMFSAPAVGGLGAAVVPDQQQNISSITYIGAQVYRVTFVTPFINLRYLVAMTTNLVVSAKNAGYIDVLMSTTNTRNELLIFGVQ